MSGTRSAEIVLGVVFLLALLLPAMLGTQVSSPRSIIDFVNGWSKFNLSLYKFFIAPAVGLGLVFALYSDPTVPWFISLFVLLAVMFLVVGALIVGATRAGRQPSQAPTAGQDDGLDYAARFRRLEDGIANSSEEQPHKKRR